MSAETPRMRGCISRREMLRQSSSGFGMMALAGLMGQTAEGAKKPDFEPKVKSVIFCYLSGGLSHIDSFDPKPRLQKEAGQPMPFQTERTMFNEDGNIMPSPWSFKNYGESGIPVSELFPDIGRHADDLTVLRSMVAPFMEHAQANFFFHSGQPFTGFPSMGAWSTYGLGSENEDLPGYVVLGSGVIPLGGINMYGNGFLPADFQGSFLFPENDEPINNIVPKEADDLQRKRLAFLSDMDRSYLAGVDNNAQVEAAIRNYETAYRMQSAVPDIVEISGETEATRQLYGLDSEHQPMAAYGRQCLLARRLVERGVRFVELTMVPAGYGTMGNPWDQHGQLIEGHSANAKTVDQPVAALLTDLKARGLLDETLVIFSGEFGRTPFVQGTNGRDHNPYGFSLVLAGGGLKPGFIYGQTDEYGYNVVEGKRTVHDLHATVLHLMGLDHEKLTFRFGGRDYRLTDVHGRVIREVLTDG